MNKAVQQGATRSSIQPGSVTFGVTLGQLIEDVLREALRRREHVEHRARVRLITMPDTVMRPDINLDNSHALLECMER